MTPLASMQSRAWWFVFLLFGVPWPAAAQSEPTCVVLCAPELKVEPTWTWEPLWARPRVESNGQVERVPRENIFELIFAVDIPTALPRLGVTLEAMFTPFNQQENEVQLEAELNINLLDTDQTGGWVSSHVDIVDKFSPAETPDTDSAYTHKLDFEWDTAFHVFKRLPEGHWLRNVEAEISLDYLATGLPKAGDVVDGVRYIDKASPWSLSFVMVIPLAPLKP
jgi:hypothetical protein